MIDLDSADWGRLGHAYGPARDIPPLLRRLAADPSPKVRRDEEPWFSLWSALCHQGEAYSASYAAVPHIVRIGSAVRGPIDFGFFLLPACVEVARRTGRGPILEGSGADDYLAALRELHACAFVHATDDWSSDMALSVAAALAAAKGHIALAEALTNLGTDAIRKINSDEF